MKKLALISLMAATVALTACSKETTEVKDTKDTTKTQAPATLPASSTQAKASEEIPQDPAAVLRSDIAKFQALEAEQAKAAEAIAKPLQEVMQKQDKAGFVKLYPQIKALTQQRIAGLKALQLQDESMQKFRDKLVEGSELGLQIQDETVKDKADEAKLKTLNEKGAKLQAEMQKIQEEIQKRMAEYGQPAAAEQPKASTEKPAANPAASTATPAKK